MSVFTKIIDGQIPGRFVWADSVCVVMATIEPHAEGHVMVIPRVEVDKFTDLDDATANHLFAVARTVGRVQEAAFGVPRAGLVIAGYGVPHCHLHLIPLHDEKAISFASARHNVPADELDAAMERLRSALVEAGYGEHVPHSMTALP